MTRPLLLMAFLLCAGCSRGAGATAGGLEQFTGTNTRAVWAQSDGTVLVPLSREVALMGLDSTDGRGERMILPGRGNYVKPMITRRGTQIVFSHGHVSPGGLEMFLVNWDGSGLKRLGKGFALAVWQNPADASDWVYAGIGAAPDQYDFPTVVRFPVDNPSAREVVWNKTLVSGDTFQVSADGRHAGGLFPWPEAGVAELPNGALKRLGEGCWTALASVRGAIMWYFDGAHRNLTLVDIRTDRRWKVNINGVPGFGNDEVYHPRWTSHPRFMVMSGPYNRGGDNQVRSGGPQTEIYLGRFSADYSRIEAWHRVTTNGQADSYPDVWISRAKNPHVVAAGGIGPEATEGERTLNQPPDGKGRIVLDGRLVKAPAIPSPASIQPYRHALLVHEYEVTKPVAGDYPAKRVLVAHWVIRDGKVLREARRAPGSNHRLTIERFDAHPELEGERLISGSDAPKLPLYYDVSAR